MKCTRKTLPENKSHRENSVMELGTHEGRFGFLILLAIVAFIEALWIYTRRKHYPWQEATTSFAVAIIKRFIDTATAGVNMAVMFWAYKYRLWDINLIDNPAALLPMFFLFEFVYYWHHRWAHEIRWLWATHSVHHSPNHMNLTVAGRLGWTGLISGSVLFFAPLSLIGFHPIAVFLMLAVNLFYQVWIHTEVIKTLGPLEWVLNTPSHHRVHHGSNPEYLDRNYGGILIIFDRLFGTFAKEEAPVVYGLTEPLRSNNPFKVALFEWGRMISDLRHVQSPRQGFKVLFGRP